MKTKYLAILEKKLDEFLDEVCDEFSEEHDIYIYPDLYRQMASAAAAVMDGSVHGQEYAASESS